MPAHLECRKARRSYYAIADALARNLRSIMRALSHEPKHSAEVPLSLEHAYLAAHAWAMTLARIDAQPDNVLSARVLRVLAVRHAEQALRELEPRCRATSARVFAKSAENGNRLRFALDGLPGAILRSRNATLHGED